MSLGEVYPIYGSITKFVNDTPGQVVVLINDQIEASMNLFEIDKIELLKNLL